MIELPAPSAANKSLCLFPIPFTSNFPFTSPPPCLQCSFLTISRSFSLSLSLHFFVSSRGGGGELWRVQSPGRGPEEHWGWQLLVHEQTAGRHPGAFVCPTDHRLSLLLFKIIWPLPQSEPDIFSNPDHTRGAAQDWYRERDFYQCFYSFKCGQSKLKANGACSDVSAVVRPAKPPWQHERDV